MDRLACLASRLDKMMFLLACLATQAGAAERWLLHGGYTGYGGTEEYGEGLAKGQVGMSSSPDRLPAGQHGASHLMRVIASPLSPTHTNPSNSPGHKKALYKETRRGRPVDNTPSTDKLHHLVKKM